MAKRLIILTGWACPEAWLKPLAQACGPGVAPEVRAVLALHSANASSSDLSRYAAGLIHWLESDSAGAWVVGWSMGGLVALEACRARPDLFQGLVLLGATARFSRTEGYPSGVRDVSVHMLARRLARDPEVALSRWLKDGARFPVLPEEEAIHLAKSALRAFTISELLEGLNYLLGADWRPELMRLRLPVLLLHAREDVLVPLAAAGTLAEALSGAQLKVYDRADHFFPMRRPGEVASDIMAFLSESVS